MAVNTSSVFWPSISKSLVWLPAVKFFIIAKNSYISLKEIPRVGVDTGCYHIQTYIYTFTSEKERKKEIVRGEIQRNDSQHIIQEMQS